MIDQSWHLRAKEEQKRIVHHKKWTLCNTAQHNSKERHVTHGEKQHLWPRHADQPTSKAFNAVQKYKASTTKQNHNQTDLHLWKILNCVPRTVTIYWRELPFNSCVAHREPICCPARLEPKYYVKETIQLPAEMDLTHIHWSDGSGRSNKRGHHGVSQTYIAAFNTKQHLTRHRRPKGPSQDDGRLQTLCQYCECS